jgi:Ran GTPase-activating protein (RanGAP) involved in mRNA processing and transport
MIKVDERLEIIMKDKPLKLTSIKRLFVIINISQTNTELDDEEDDDDEDDEDDDEDDEEVCEFLELETLPWREVDRLLSLLSPEVSSSP